MAIISILQPGGELPRVDPKLLPSTMAQVANNVDLRRGRLEGVFAHVSINETISSLTKTMFRYAKETNGGNGYWFTFSSDVDVVEAPIIDDDWGRVYWTGDAFPKMTAIDVAVGGAPYPSIGYQLGIDPPSSGFSAAGPVGPAPEGAQKLSTFYVMTYMSKYGEESPPCVVSDEVIRWDGDTVTLSALPIHSGNNVIASKLIYRSEGGGEFLYVGAVGAGAVTFSDSIDSAGISEPIPSVLWDKPNASMVGLKSLSSGGMVGFFGKTLCFSEPGFPHAWPVGYRIAIPHMIVGVVETSQGIIVLTDAKPYVVNGSHPESMGSYPLDRAQACVSRRGIVDMGEYALYPSPDGLIVAGASDGAVLSESVITAEQWKAYKPETINAFRHNERYIAFFDNGATQGAFSFDPQEGLRHFDQWAECGLIDLEDDALFFKNGTAINSWQSGVTRETYTYRGKKHALDIGETFNTVMVDAEAYPVDINVIVDGEVTALQVTARKSQRVRLPRGYVTELEVVSNKAVVGLWLASSVGELP